MQKKKSKKNPSDLEQRLKRSRKKLALAIAAAVERESHPAAAAHDASVMAAEAADAFISHVLNPGTQAAIEYGAKLAALGVKEEVIAGLWAPLAGICLGPDADPAVAGLEAAGSFVSALLEGALASRRAQGARDREMLMDARVEADQANRRAGTFAHGFNNVLTAISGFLQLLLMEAEPESQMHQDITRIKEVVAHGADLIKQLRHISHGPESSADEAAPARTAPAHGSATVLVVDDESAVREVMTRTLGSRGYTVCSVDNGADALSLFMDESRTFDCVVLDMIMPNLGGMETLSRLKAIRPSVPVLVVTGSETGGLQPLLAVKGADGCMEKPLDLEVFAQKVGTLIGRTRGG